MERDVVSIEKCSKYDNKLVAKALEKSLKNIHFEFKPNQTVLIKPNILSAEKPEKAITTHPSLIDELIKILKKYNTKIYIGESSFDKTGKSFKVSGIEAVAKKHNIEIINFDEQEKYSVDINHKQVKKIYLPNILKKIDFVINMPKLKTHTLTKMTCAVKNNYGFIAGQTKSLYHRLCPNPISFSKLLIQIHEQIKPQLNICDGVYGLEGEGPGATGTPIKTGIILTSKNAFALDFVAAEKIGYKPKSILINKYAVKQKLINPKKIKIIGSAKDKKFNYKKPKSVMTKLMGWLYFLGKPKISFDYEKCISCGLCAKRCPTKAITLTHQINKNKNFPICNHKLCIRCFCCIEGCPEKTISLKEPFIQRTLKSIVKFIRGLK